MRSVNNKISSMQGQTNLWWISNIKCSPKDIETLFTKIDKEDFLRMAELRKSISNHSRNELKVWKFYFKKQNKTTYQL